MIFPRYANYKSSGVEWLGDVPQHWHVVRLGNLYAERIEAGSDDLPILSVSIHDGVSDDELDPDELERKVTRSEDKTKYKAVQPGDLVYNMMRAWQGGFGSVEVAGLVSPAYVVARPRRDNFFSTFVERVLRSPNAVEEMRRHSRGVTDFRLRLYWEEFKDLRIALPPRDEQVEILSVIGHEAEKIDALVREQERLIALLTEKRQALISHAVIKGLDPNSPMKDSGVEWLGEVPAHWTRSRIKHYCSNVADCLHTTPTYAGDLLYPAIRTADIDRGRLLLQQARLVNEEVYTERIRRLEPCARDILYSREGERFGMAALVPEDTKLCLGQRMMMFRTRAGVDAAYFMWLLNSDAVFQQVLSTVAGATSPHVNISDVVNFHVPEPPVAEQEIIAQHIDAEVHAHDALIGEAEAAISLLQERRSALVSNAVTGKIDVRGLVAADAEAA